MPMFTNRRLLTHAHTRSITPKRSCVTTSCRASVPWDEAGTDCRSRVRHFAPPNRGTTTAWRTNRTAACGWAWGYRHRSGPTESRAMQPLPALQRPTNNWVPGRGADGERGAGERQDQHQLLLPTIAKETAI